MAIPYSLLLGAKERGALRTRGVVLVEELVELVEVGGGAAVDVVPPVADKVLLVENGSVGAQDYKNKNWSAHLVSHKSFLVTSLTAIGVSVRSTHVEDLAIAVDIAVDAGKFLGATVEPSVRDSRVNRKVDTSLPRNRHVAIWP